MVTMDYFFTFSAAAFAVILIPGPTVLLVTGYSISGGLRKALLCIVGVCLGDAVAMTLTFSGLGAILSASVDLFTALKWAGAAYLIFLGIELWRAPTRQTVLNNQEEHSHFQVVSRAFTVNVLHPKGLAFYVAFLPQFIRPELPAVPQMITFGLTFVFIAFCILLSYALTAIRLREVLIRPKVRNITNRSGAICLIGAGLYTGSLSQ